MRLPRHANNNNILNQGCNVNITMDTIEQADDLRATAEQIKQRRLAAAAAKQPITISGFESLKQDLTRQIRAVFVRATLAVCQTCGK